MSAITIEQVHGEVIELKRELLDHAQAEMAERQAIVRRLGHLERWMTGVVTAAVLGNHLLSYLGG